jgi:hypothetical protein
MRGQKGYSLRGAAHAGNLRYDVDSSQTGARWLAVHSASNSAVGTSSAASKPSIMPLGIFAMEGTA